MRKICSVLACLFISSVCVAQEAPRWAIFAGPQITNAKHTIDGEKQETEQKYGFQLGVTAKVPFDGKLFFAPSAYYSMKGYKATFSRPSFPPDSLAIDNDTRFHTFELAPLLQIDLGNGPGNCFVRFGPSFDIQLAGREKYNLRTGGSVDRKMKFNFGEYGFIGANLNLQFGYETAGGIFFYANYSRGAASISNADNGPQIRHRAYGITIGKFLGKGKLVEDTRVRE